MLGLQLNRIRQHVSAAQVVLNKADPLARDVESPVASLVVADEFANREREFLDLIHKLETEVHSRVSMERSAEELEMRYQSAKEERNRFEAEYEVLSTLCTKAGSEYQEKQVLLSSRREEVSWLKEIDTAFGLTGVQVSSHLELQSP